MNVPKLRFKEFNDEWIETKIQNVATVVGGGTPSTDEPKYWGNEINWFTPSEIGKTKYVTISNRKISQNGLKNSSAKLLPNGTILLSSRATVGEASILLNEASTNQGFQSLIVNENNCNEFIYYLKYKYKREMLIKSFGSTFLEISKSNVENIKIKIPSKEEQFKIANFLSLLDKKIELQSKKIEDLKLFKKGLINVLNKKSYQETTLGKIGKFQTSSIDKLVKENEKIVSLYNYMDVYKHKIIMTQDLSKLSKTSAKDNQIITNNLKRGDILFTPSSETPDDIGHSICIQENLPNTVYSYHLLRYRPNIIIDPLFSNYYFNNSKIRKQIIRYATGATRYTVSLDSFLKIKVDIPDLITQKKYGLLLYSTDKKVNKEMFKLNKLRELKKVLMQDMFV